MTISEAAKLSPRVMQTLNGIGDIWELNDRSTRAVTLANLTADDWEPVYDKIEVEHGSFPWAMYMMLEKGMQVRNISIGQGSWIRYGKGEGGTYTFAEIYMGDQWECREAE